MKLPITGLMAIVGCLPIMAWSEPAAEPVDAAILNSYSDPVLSSFVQAVVATNPRVRAAQAALDASRARESAAGRPLYNPEIEADYESAVDNTWTVGIGHTFDWAGKREARSLAAASDRQSVEAEFLAMRRELAVDLLFNLSFYETGVQRNELANERMRVMQDFADLAQRRFEAGDLNQVEADLATLALIDAQIQRATAGAELAEARQAVREMTLSATMDQWPAINSDLPMLSEVGDPQALVSSLPEVQAAQRRVAAANAIVELREREKRLDPTISVRGGREDKSTLIGVNLSIPIFIRNSFSYEVAAAMAESDQAQQLANDVTRRAYARFISATERYQLSREAWQGWSQTGLASLQRQTDILKRMWEAGELSTTDFLVQIRQSLDTRDSALDLKLTMWRAWFEWLAASGQVDQWLGQK